MRLTFRHMAVLLIVIYLFIPAMGYAYIAVLDAEVTNVRGVGVVDSPCDTCPCSDSQGPRCCDSVTCICSFHSPPVQAVQIPYAPFVIITRYSEAFRKLPQVYVSIFVPPQNQSPDYVCKLVEHKQISGAVGRSVTVLRHTPGNQGKGVKA